MTKKVIGLIAIGSTISVVAPTSALLVYYKDKIFKSSKSKEKTYTLNQIIQKLKEDKILDSDFEIEKSLATKANRKKVLVQILQAVKDGKNYQYIKQLFARHYSKINILNNNTGKMISKIFEKDIAKEIINILTISEDTKTVVDHIFSEDTDRIINFIEKIAAKLSEDKVKLQKFKDIATKFIFEETSIANNEDTIKKIKNFMNSIQEGDLIKKGQTLTKQQINKQYNKILSVFAPNENASFIKSFLRAYDSNNFIAKILARGIKNSSIEEIKGFLSTLLKINNLKTLLADDTKAKNNLDKLHRNLTKFLGNEKRKTKIAKIIKTFFS